VVRLPPDPESCQGANVGDVINMHYVGAYELPSMKGATLATRTESTLDLLDPEATYENSRWVVFDSSEWRLGSRAFQFPLGNGHMVSGLEMGLHGLCRGERRVIYIPDGLGYGRYGNSAMDIPANANLRYDVEVQEIMSWNNNGGASSQPDVGQLLE